MPLDEPTWLKKMITRIRSADSDEAARAAVKDYINPATGEREEGGGDPDSDTHIHVHLEGKNGEGNMAGGKDEFEDPNDPGGDPEAGTPSLEELAAAVASLSQRVAQLEEGEEGEMELEDPDTQDARRYTFRRGNKMKARDEDTENTPERNEEMIGETDLPGIEDLDKRMAAGDKRKARDAALRMRDSADMEDGWREMVALAEVIQPGVRVGTFDAALPVVRQAARMCAFRRRMVDGALKDATHGKDIQALVGVRSVDGLTCDTVKVAFTTIGNLMRNKNNDGIIRRSLDTPNKDNNGGAGDTPRRPMSPAEINKANREFYATGSGNGSARR